LYRDLIYFKKDSQPRTNKAKDEKNDFVTSCIRIGGNVFSQLFTVRGDNDVMQREIHTAEPLVPKPSAFEV